MEEFRGQDREFIRFIFSLDREKMDVGKAYVACGHVDEQSERMAV